MFNIGYMFMLLVDVIDYVIEYESGSFGRMTLTYEVIRRIKPKYGSFQRMSHSPNDSFG